MSIVLETCPAPNCNLTPRSVNRRWREGRDKQVKRELIDKLAGWGDRV